MAVLVALAAAFLAGLSDAAFSNVVTPDDIETMFTDWGCNYRGLSGLEAATLVHQDINEAISMNPLYAGFVNGPDPDVNKQEAAAFFASVKKETGGLAKFEEDWKSNGQYCTSEAISGAGAELKASGLNYPCNLASRGYHGRGAIQLTWNINYGRFSEFIYNDKNVLLNNPDLIVGNGPLGWAATLWFWMSNQDFGGVCPPVALSGFLATGNDSCHKAMQSGNGMGKTINIINGGYECCTKSGERWSAVARVQSYFNFLGMLGAKKAHRTCPDGDFGNCEISRECPLIHDRLDSGFPITGTCTSYIQDMWMPKGTVRLVRWKCPSVDPGAGAAPAPAPTTAPAPAPTTAPAPALSTTVAVTEVTTSEVGPAPTSASTCKSIVSHISDEWCQGVGCAVSYAAYCTVV